MQKTGLVLVTAAVALVLASGVAMAVTLTGEPGDDSLRDTPQRDRLFGGTGDDLIAGLAKGDELSGKPTTTSRAVVVPTR